MGQFKNASIDKLQTLLFHDDIENVVQGLDLLSTLIKDPSDIYKVFDITTPPNILKHLAFNLYKWIGYPKYGYVLVNEMYNPN